MKKFCLFLVSLGILFLSTGFVEAQTDKGIKLRFSQHYPATHFFSQHGASFFMERVKTLSNGKITFAFFPGEQLAKTREQLDLGQTGGADIVGVVPSYAPGRMRLSAVMELPGAFTSARTGAAMYRKIAEEKFFLENDFLKNGVRPLILNTFEPYEVFIKDKKPIRFPEDIKGKKLRTTGESVGPSLKAIGAVQIAMPTIDVYDALQRGTVDGLLSGYSSLLSYKLDEVVKSFTVGCGLTSLQNTWVINEKVWQSLPEETKKILLQAGEEASDNLGQKLDELVDNAIVKLEKKGIIANKLTPAEKAKWQEATKSTKDSWVAQMEKLGLPGKQTVEKWWELKAAMEK